MTGQGWLSVAQTADAMAISTPRVRRLIADQVLVSTRVGRHVLVDASSVHRRIERRPPAGRPLSPRAAWAVLAAFSDDAHSPEQAVGRAAAGDRRLRHRLSLLLRQPRSAQDWQQLVRRRAQARRYWAHPAVVAEIMADGRVSVGRARAAAAAGLDVSPGDDALAYVAEEHLPTVVSQYLLEDDPSGPIDLRVVTASVGSAGPLPGQPVIVAAAVMDMLDSDDARLRHAASGWLDGATKRLAPSVTATPE